jgi:deazaflavin-dependent oxidoreductase (nitroreductase family)
MIRKWIFKQFMQFQIFMYRRSGSKTMGYVRGMPLLLLTTVGRKTGKQRVTPVMYLRDGDNYVITASNAGEDKHPSWFLNLQANPQARIEVGNMTGGVMAHPASPEEKGRLWAQLIEQAPFFEGYKKKTTRDIPMVILQLTGRLLKVSDQEGKS